ncbi:STM3941 family protein [Weeksella sp. HMSC059D05]|uniref:STM3941 family protein n=1 Tax=Weeksella sp. HMSC059D05 TaxID=1715139 RepID=UPI0008A43A7A|nr:STM3941 family protein [Weeksella sp. HMSC059D05]OFM84652.1 hypothetical protein HMPREF2660_08145 [Weeksella sp. HMSC059D05]
MILTIKYSKSKIFGFILFFLVMNITCIGLIINPQLFVSKFISNQYFIFVFGILGFLYSFLMFISNVLLLFNRKKAIIVSELELEDNSTYESIGVIKWDDIDAIDTCELYSGKYLELTINNKEKYIKNNRINILKLILMYLNNWKPKDKIIINCRRLDCTFDELEKIIKDNFRAFNKQKHSASSIETRPKQDIKRKGK